MAALADDIFAEMYRMLREELAAAGIRVVAKEAYRSLAGQAAAIKKRGLFGAGGFAAPVGRSYHNYGFAVDVSIQPQNWKTFGRIAEELGFRWGGRFSKPEPWHIDFGDFLSISEARSLFDRAFLVGVN